MIVRRPNEFAVPLPTVTINMEKLSNNSNQRFGECSNYAVDNTGKFLTCVFAETNKMCVINLKTMKIEFTC